MLIKGDLDFVIKGDRRIHVDESDFGDSFYTDKCIKLTLANIDFLQEFLSKLITKKQVRLMVNNKNYEKTHLYDKALTHSRKQK